MTFHNSSPSLPPCAQDDFPIVWDRELFSIFEKDTLMRTTLAILFTVGLVTSVDSTARAVPITYTLVTPPSHGGPSVGGFVTTDGTIGTLVPADITAWGWFMTGPLGTFDESTTNPAHPIRCRFLETSKRRPPSYSCPIRRTRASAMLWT